MKNPSTGVLLGVVALGLLAFHAWVIADDVWAVVCPASRKFQQDRKLQLHLRKTRRCRNKRDAEAPDSGEGRG